MFLEKNINTIYDNDEYNGKQKRNIKNVEFLFQLYVV